MLAVTPTVLVRLYPHCAYGNGPADCDCIATIVETETQILVFGNCWHCNLPFRAVHWVLFYAMGVARASQKPRNQRTEHS